MIRALACDIDGTITDERRRLDPEAVKLLRVIEKMGIPVVLATGNVLCLTEAASTYIGTTGPVIAENGGIVKEREKDPVYLCKLEEGEIKRAFEHLREELPVRIVKRSDLRVTEIVIYRDFDVAVVREALSEFDVRVVDTKFAIHITNPMVNKGEALSIVAEMLGLRIKDFAAIGDGKNDVEMLEKADLSIGVGDERLEGVTRFVTGESFAKGGVEALKYVIDEVGKDI